MICAELATTQVLPELIAAHLIHEVNVIEPVTIHIRDGNAGAVIVVHRFVIDASVIHHVVEKGDSAVFERVGEAKLEKHLEPVHRVQLCFLPRRQRIHSDVWIRKIHVRCGLA